MFSEDLEKSLNHAIDLAQNQRCEFITVEHLLCALLKDTNVQIILQFHEVSCNELKQELHRYIRKCVPTLTEERSDNHDVIPTLAFQRVLQRALFAAQTRTETEANGVDILMSIFGEENCYAAYLLAKRGIEREDILSCIEEISKGVADQKHFIFQLKQIGNEKQFKKRPARNNKTRTQSKESQSLEFFTRNLNEKALRGDVDPLIGREREIQRTIQILHRRHKNNPLFVGEAGVGKTALAEGLALKITQGEVPKRLEDAVIYSLDLGSLVAGTRYRGDFEERFKEMIEQLSQKPHAILFIDEIHTLIGAGSTTNTLDASNMLKPLLSSNEIICIGSTTYKEFHNVFEKDHALARRFQKIDVVEPSNKEALKILQGLKSRFEMFHQSKYTTNALRSAVELSVRYLHDRALPDKAIDIIDEAGASLNVQNDQSVIHDKKRIVRTSDIEKIVAQVTQIPIQQITQSERQTLGRLDQNLKMQIFGQDEAIEKITSAIKSARCGLKEANQTIGNFLFTGPTGVGKTELAKQLARLTQMSLLRFDMSEYMERHTVSRLIGAPPGYVGFDQGGLLSDAVLKKPYAVLLLDEIEKAHTDIFNLLLQIMDYGKLTNASGCKIDFSNVILIMTSNVGSADGTRDSIGFTQSKQRHASDTQEAVKRLFTPEFRNRLDATVVFNPLDEDTILLIVDKLIAQLQVQLEQRKIKLHTSPQLRQWLGRHGFDEQLGARPIQRLINEKIKQPLINEWFNKKLQTNLTVRYTVKNDKPVFTMHTQKRKEAQEEKTVAARLKEKQ